ncbi:hypothetical protein [Actinacidiphila rubida]|uniref:Uncharacterized protein n=1 Tax=Actinacidiphila rubida TaxID=310780 RepID=A0A1H8L7G0_9ACTN|nr:hypothetical protein [Actinacidiphila rubida]SEO01047.1 hypothetical protein SAMN05216267_101575 [Actinacidiphila rubida]
MTIDVDAFNAKAIPGLEALTKLMLSGASDHAPAPEALRPFQVGWGFLAALHRQAAAVVVLHHNGLAHEAAPNRRLMVEYVAKLQWLVRDGDAAVESMNKAHQYAHSKLREAADAGEYQYDAEAADAVRDAVIPSGTTDQFNNMKNLLERLGGGLFQSWVSETQLSHATLTAAGCFYKDTLDKLELLAEPTYGIEGDPMEMSPYIAFFFMYFGMAAFNELMNGSPWTDELDRIGAANGLASSE